MSKIVKYNEARLDVAVAPTFDQAQEITNSLDAMTRNMQWWVGDWLNYCESLFPETWTQLLPDVGRANKSIMNWKYVADRVSKNGRYENLSFSHHAVVAKMESERQEHWLQMASEGGWTEKRLRDEIKGEAGDKPPKIQFVPCVCPECDHKFNQEVTG